MFTRTNIDLLKRALLKLIFKMLIALPFRHNCVETPYKQYDVWNHIQIQHSLQCLGGLYLAVSEVLSFRFRTCSLVYSKKIIGQIDVVLKKTIKFIIWQFCNSFGTESWRKLPVKNCGRIMLAERQISRE